MSTTGTVTLSGFFSGMDTESIIAQLKKSYEVPITRLQAQSDDLDVETTAFDDLASTLNNLADRINDLSDPALFRKRTGTSSAATVASVSVDKTAALGTNTVTITQVATNSMLRSGTGANTQISGIPAATTKLSAVGGMDVTDKSFSINGVKITLNGTEAIDDGTGNSVISKINNSGAGVTAAYNATTGKFTLTSNTSAIIVLGSGADTSNFLQQSQLFNNGDTSVESAIGIGRLDADAALSSAGLGTTPTTGTFYVNGVEITYSNGDTLEGVLSKITNSSAGVIATYDDYTDRIILTSSKRGAQGISVTDGTSNLGSALRLTSSDSTLNVGKSTKFTVGSDTTVRVSDDETLSASELGLTGVSVTALATGTTTITVSPDTAAVKTAINAFVDQYNSTQNIIESYVKIDTADPDNNGVLASDGTVSFLSSDLRGVFSMVMSSNSSVKMLSDLGIDTNGDDNTITSVDDTKLTTALTNNLEEVIKLFTDTSEGISAKLSGRVDRYINSTNGAIIRREENIKDEQDSLAQQIEAMQARVDSQIEILRAAFASMEEAYSSSESILSTLQNLSTS